MKKFEVLIDSDAFIGLVVEKDVHHEKAQKHFKRLIEQRTIAATTNYVITEAASTLSRRFSQALARQFLTLADDFLMITITPEMHQQSSHLFRQQDKDKTSFVDMSNVIVMQELEIPQIFSFDKVYPDDFQLTPMMEAG